MAYEPQIVVIGAGIVGLSTACALLEQGMNNVLVLEQETVNHERSTSSSMSRLLRFEYPDPFYAGMVKISLELWKELERQVQKTLYTPAGLLAFGNEEDGNRQAYEAVRGLGLASELLTEQVSRQRFPEFDVRKYGIRTFTQEAGVLHASTCLQMLKRVIQERGGRIAERSQVTRLVYGSQSHPLRVQISTGEEISAERVVVAMGPWVHHLLGHLHLPVRPTRQYLLYFAGLAPTRFGLGNFPAFMGKELYGFPIYRGSHGWLKAGSHIFGRPVDPDAPVAQEESVITQTRRDLQELVPGLREATLAHVEACMYDVSPDEDFIIDHLPDDRRVAFATGLSGHAFKFGLLLGQIMSSLVCDTPPVVPLERFRLARFARQFRSQVTSVA
jgi:monomeric sarcosine oxidase